MTKILIELFSYEFKIKNRFFKVFYTLEHCWKDLWFGFYWENEYNDEELLERYNMDGERLVKLLDIYFIGIPTLPIHCALYEKILSDGDKKLIEESDYVKKMRAAHGKFEE